MEMEKALDALDTQRVQREYRESQESEVGQAIEVERTQFPPSDPRRKEVGQLESASAAAQLTPLFVDAENIYDRFQLDVNPYVRRAEEIFNYATGADTHDPAFDPSPQLLGALDEFGAGSIGMLASTTTQEEYDLMANSIREQQKLQILASSTLTGQVTQFATGLISAENLLMSAATVGMGAWGSVAKNLKQGITANTIKGGIVGGSSSFIGSTIDADNNLAFSEEDIGWSSAFGLVGGGLYGRYVGRTAIPDLTTREGQKLHSFGSAAYDGLEHMYARAVGKGYQQYIGTAQKVSKDAAKLKDDIVRKRTGIQKESIDNVDFSMVDEADELLDLEVTGWNSRNAMSERLQNVSTAEAKLDTIGTMQSSSAKFSQSESPLANALGTMGYSRGTGSVVKHDSMDVRMERRAQHYSHGFSMAEEKGWSLYRGQRNTQGDRGIKDRLTSYLSDKIAFNEETLLYRNSVYNGSPLKKVNPIIKEASEEFDKVYEALRKEAARSGLAGFDEILERAGYMHVRHERDAYMNAVKKHGREAVVGVIKKSLMSKGGAKIVDEIKAREIAQAFVDRFTQVAPDLRAGNVLEDDAWEIMQKLFAEKGLDFEGTNLKQAFNDEVSGKVVKDGKARYAKHRTPLDLEVEEGGLRMLDLINTDVANLNANYAMSMSGHIAMAEKGITDRGRWLKIRKRILEQDPKMEQALDDMHNTFSTGRVAGGVNNRLVALALKGTALSLLNSLGFPQLAEANTIMATYGIRNFFAEGAPIVQDMFMGIKSTATTALATDIVENWLPIGREHFAFRPRLNQEVQSGSRLSDATNLDKFDSLVSMGMGVQGMTSLFNHVRAAEQSLAFQLFTQKVARHVHKGKGIDEQLASLGFSEDLFDKVSRSMKGDPINKTKGHATYTKAGELEDLGINNWDLEVQEAFADIITINQNSMVQKALAGESIAWMSKDEGAFLMQFKKFPIDSIRKQLIRKGTIGKEHLATSALLGVAVAGSVMTARNYLTGSNTSADMQDVLRQGVMYNSDLGSLQMMWDLGLSMTGVNDSLLINPYAKFSDIVSPPSLSVVNTQLGGLAAVGDMADMNIEDGNTWRWLRAAPIVGNLPILGRFQRPD